MKLSPRSTVKCSGKSSWILAVVLRSALQLEIIFYRMSVVSISHLLYKGSYSDFTMYTFLAPTLYIPEQVWNRTVVLFFMQYSSECMNDKYKNARAINFYRNELISSECLKTAYISESASDTWLRQKWSRLHAFWWETEIVGDHERYKSYQRPTNISPRPDAEFLWRPSILG